MAGNSPPVDLAAARRLHRELIFALGGYAFDLAGGTLVTHERIPVPAFNFVDDARVAVRRQTAFFEKALDHYFQRALRPTFRVEPDPPAHIDRTLRHFGFVPSEEPLVFLSALTGTAPSGPGGVVVEELPAERAREIAAFWTHPKEREEFERAIDVVANHPNPEEHLVPLLARHGGRPAAAALLYRKGVRAEIEAVATLPDLRGRGIATDLVAASLGVAGRDGAATLTVLSATPRLARRLAPLGFVESGRLLEYRLPPEAQLAIPPPGPPAPPRWRPPRGGPPGDQPRP